MYLQVISIWVVVEAMRIDETNPEKTAEQEKEDQG